MTSKCKGILGYIFGHEFKEYLIEIKPSDSIGDMNGPPNAVKEVIYSLSKRKYTVVCKRCGKVIDNGMDLS